ncbi:unnamed protein product (macronuclear) [Paramecium tetraurelia]|uniref:Uncharacterized protein n=1 Tax=Paramecium tetraurelia TaxID=5888 RepID=A0D346_PARTE|nr:uncharacterized protein GSPATT00012948001 [Paramecium tetraurelia]CAK77463.1 unnamed protein product [Paramecium tetraurelia]|eukprot:XP_001444860.1 hypothetical protein (macronuclear) [Paramecium tetraurelia strain d4-2]
MGVCGGKNSKRPQRETYICTQKTCDVARRYSEEVVNFSAQKLNNTGAIFTDSNITNEVNLAQTNTILISKKKNYNGDPLKYHLDCLKSAQDRNSYDIKIGVPIRQKNQFSIEIEGSCQKLQYK